MGAGMTIDSEPLLALTGVTVDYRSGRDRIVRALDDVTLSARAGESVGLVGGTGSGKSTMAQVIMGMVRPTGGTVRVIGADPGALRGRALREHQRRVQIVPQDPYSSLDPRMRVADIVGEPLTLGARSLSAAHRARVDEVLDLVGIAPARSGQFPHQFSGGQRQRLAIARALLKNSPILILDEATSSLDAESEGLVQDALANLMRNRTAFVIAHRLSTVRRADAIVALEKGRVAEIGRHEELLSKPAGVYAKLYALQIFDQRRDTGDAGRVS
jgi:ABC-type multidrug transport system fused ATPase/permease subunit